MSKVLSNGMSFEEFKELSTKEKLTPPEGELSEEAQRLKGLSDELMTYTEVSDIANKIEELFTELKVMDKSHKTKLMNLKKARDTTMCMIMIWNWILAGIPNKNFSAR